MTLVFTNGTITTTASEQNLFDITTDNHFATYIFTHNMASGDAVTIRVYILDQNAAVMRLYRSRQLKDAQSIPSYFIPFLPTKQYRVSIQRDLGTDRAYTWQKITEG